MIQEDYVVAVFPHIFKGLHAAVATGDFGPGLFEEAFRDKKIHIVVINDQNTRFGCLEILHQRFFFDKR